MVAHVILCIARLAYITIFQSYSVKAAGPYDNDNNAMEIDDPPITTGDRNNIHPNEVATFKVGVPQGPSTRPTLGKRSLPKSYGSSLQSKIPRLLDDEASKLRGTCTMWEEDHEDSNGMVTNLCHLPSSQGISVSFGSSIFAYGTAYMSDLKCGDLAYEARRGRVYMSRMEGFEGAMDDPLKDFHTAASQETCSDIFYLLQKEVLGKMTS